MYILISILKKMKKGQVNREGTTFYSAECLLINIEGNKGNRKSPLRVPQQYMLQARFLDGC